MSGESRAPIHAIHNEGEMTRIMSCDSNIQHAFSRAKDWWFKRNRNGAHGSVCPCRSSSSSRGCHGGCKKRKTLQKDAKVEVQTSCFIIAKYFADEVFVVAVGSIDFLHFSFSLEISMIKNIDILIFNEPHVISLANTLVLKGATLLFGESADLPPHYSKAPQNAPFFWGVDLGGRRLV